MKKSHLIQQLMEYIEDLGESPMVLIDTRITETTGLPLEHANEDGYIILNLARRATRDSLVVTDSEMSARLSFKGEIRDCSWHIQAVVCISGQEQSPKTVFPKAEHIQITPNDSKPHLRVVK